MKAGSSLQGAWASETRQTLLRLSETTYLVYAASLNVVYASLHVLERLFQRLLYPGLSM